MALTQQAEALFGIKLTAEQESQFEIYTRELASWNVHTNLTAIIEPHEVEIRHYLDSLSIARVAPMKAGIRLADVGTGAGFPGLPLKIAFPQIEVTLIEATGKKVAFLDHVIAVLKLDGIKTLRARAEEAGHIPRERAAYDVVVARAVARLPALVEYLLPLAKVGGKCIAMKGITAKEEAESSRHALALLGGKLNTIERIVLPDVPDEHYLVIVEKTAPTPSVYPRQPGVPTKKPL